MSARVVTISAAFGARGDVVGPAVAERLALPFLDRAIPVQVAGEIGCTLEEALAHDGRAESGIGRILAGAARLPNVALGAMDVYLPEQAIIRPEEFVEHTERVIHQAAEQGGGVLLGRAAAVVLAGLPGVLHVRLDGPRERRLAVAAYELAKAGTAAPAGRRGRAAGGTRGPGGATGTPDRDVERMLDDNDRARTAYVKHFYGADPADPRLYHLVIDTTRLPASAAVDLIAAAARAL
ncbi:cytidylate kinase-like family protein [Actinomadura montaniterrae]|uniref:Cytidylate kinase-like family protein n=1 Tax=Actinomadura montaniterrae TaxID=1803903 RepID=A0A6L3VIZ8_9ACTN|nr:cytidylate kinase-like family protein [Actinomadura montaniterrae]KAB2363278.1 cytidylate kinase-like family protein [Actinomadura montaniterrae]